jgi:Excreted virulence factor EspC, type VII ESX diderm
VGGGLLQVDPIGLRMLAADCQSWAAQVAVSGTSGISGASSCQATAAAVMAGHADVTAAGQALAGRMYATAAKLVASSDTYKGQDDSNAARLNAVAASV